jgi:hypothetical protein
VETFKMKTSSVLVMRSLVTALMAAAVGCGGSHADDRDITVARAALTATADVLGFEDPASWSTTTAGVTLTRSTTHSQGSFSLQVKPSNSNGFTPIASTPLSTLAAVSPTLAWDVMLPTQQPNPNWFGTAQTYLSCPSRGISSAFLGQVELTGKPLNVWNTITFPLSNAQITSLLQAGYSDLTITVVLNVPVPTTGVYRIDNLRFLPLAANACGGRPNGTSCTDGNPCTTFDTCQAGACKAGPPVVCQASDQCHTAGVCNSATGVCSNPAKANGTTCDDGNKCTQTDACQAGVCAGANPVTCVASDACHVAGSCVPATGACTNPAASDGTTCNDQNACTATSACKTGVCVGATTKICPPLDQCHVGVCDPASGACGFGPAADGTACNDGDTCTSGDTCQSGVCGGTRDSLCALSIRFEQLVDLGNGARVAIFSYTNPGKAVSAPYGAGNFISVDGQMVATPTTPIPQSFGTGDHPGTFAYALPIGASTVTWTLGGHVAASIGPAVPPGTSSTGGPTATVSDATGHSVAVGLAPSTGSILPTVRLAASPQFVTLPQAGTATATVSVLRVGGLTDPIVFDVNGQTGVSGTTLANGPEPASSYTVVFAATSTAPLGTRQVLLTARAPNIGGNAPQASLVVTVVPPALSTVSIASLNMKAPLTLQGAQSWSHFADIDSNVGAPAGVEVFNNYTTTPLPPFLTDPNAPRWVKGNGFTVQDNLGLPPGVSGVPKVIVQTSRVNFEVGVSLTDDTSALAMTATADALDVPIRDPINVGTGVTSCTSSLFPSVVEGNHGRYTVRIERWQDGATNCQPDEQADPDYPFDVVTFDRPSPTGFPGCWVSIGSETTDLYGSQPFPDIKGLGVNDFRASKDGTFERIMNVQVDMPGFATFVRYVVQLEEADTRVPNDTDVIAWGPTRSYPDTFSCQERFNFTGITPFTELTVPTTGQGYSCPIGTDPNPAFWDTFVPFCPPAVGNLVLPGEFSNEGPLSVWRFSRPLVNGRPQQQSFAYEQASNPFQVVIEPIAIAQMKVLPLTILYQPPGDKSTANYSLSQSFGTNMTANNLVNQTQSTSVNSKVGDGDKFEFKSLSSAGGGGGDDSTAAFMKAAGFSVSEMTSDSSTWDNTTLLGSGRSTQVAQANVATFQSIKTSTVGPLKNLVPGAAGTFDQEPFWGDTFVLIVHPQVGVWQVNSSSNVVLLGADGAPNSPALFFVTLKNLDDCAHHKGNVPNGISINTSSHSPPDSTDVLDADDCLQLAQLDPFYGVGQRLPTAPNARVITPLNAVTATNYGTTLDGATLTQKLDNVVTYSNTTTTTNAATYTATVTDAFTSAVSGSVTLSAFGFSFTPSFSQSGTTTNVNGWTVTFTSSFAATVSSSIGIEGVLGDDHPMAQFPAVFVFQDAAFGGFMFQDRNAPLPP